MADFWDGKTRCWEFLGCAAQVHTRCAAFLRREPPCREVAGTECRKILNFEWECRDCKVFRLYGSVPTGGGPMNR